MKATLWFRCGGFLISAGEHVHHLQFAQEGAFIVSWTLAQCSSLGPDRETLSRVPDGFARNRRWPDSSFHLLSTVWEEAGADALVRSDEALPNNNIINCIKTERRLDGRVGDTGLGALAISLSSWECVCVVCVCVWTLLLCPCNKSIHLHIWMTLLTSEYLRLFGYLIRLVWEVRYEETRETMSHHQHKPPHQTPPHTLTSL